MNSKYFYSLINRRFKINEIAGLLVGDRWIEEVDEVKAEVHLHFKRQFSAGSDARL